MASKELLELIERLGSQRSASVALGFMFLLGALVLAGCGIFFMIELPMPWRRYVAGLFWLAAGFMLRGVQRRWRATALQVLQRDPRPLVIYFRPFEYDLVRHSDSPGIDVASAIFQAGGAFVGTREEFITPLLRRAGPTLALGQGPLKEIGELGATRIYCPDSDWQQTVEVLLRNARAAVFSLFENKLPQALRWEMLAARDAVPCDCIFILPDYREKAEYGNRKRRDELNGLLKEVGFQGDLDQRLEPGSVIHFTTSGVMRTVHPEHKLTKKYHQEPRLDALHRALINAKLVTGPPSKYNRPLAGYVYLTCIFIALMSFILFLDSFLNLFDRLFQ